MSRKAEEESVESMSAAKRQRLGSLDDVPAPTATFHDIHADVLVNVFSFLTRDEMDNASILSQSLAEARNHPSLDQTRAATIAIRKSKTIHDLYATIASNGWETTFSIQSNKKYLKVRGLEKLKEPDDYTEGWVDRAPNGDLRLDSITSLDMSAEPKVVQTKINSSEVEGVMHILPNLQEVDLSYVYYSSMKLMGLERACRTITRLTWKGCNSFLDIDGPNRVAHLNVDDCCGHELGYGYQFHLAMETGNLHSYCLFKSFPNLECLSLMNAQSKEYGSNMQQPVSQEFLIKVVRFHPTLRWLRSDLTDENIVMLKLEKPQVTLVNNMEQSAETFPEPNSLEQERQSRINQVLSLVLSAGAEDRPWLEAIERQVREKLQELEGESDDYASDEESEDDAESADGDDDDEEEVDESDEE